MSEKQLQFDSTITRRAYAKLLVVSALRSFDFWFFTILFIGPLAFGFANKFLLIFGLTALPIWIVYFAARLSYSLFSPSYKKWYAKRHFTFGDGEFVVEFPDTEQTIKWSALSGWLSADHFYTLKFSNGSIIMIPESDIPAGEVDNFENMLNTKIDKLMTTTKRKIAN